MKFAQFVAAFAILASVLSANWFAKDNHSGKFTLTDPVRVGSTELAPGRYKAEWSGPADAVKIEISQNGKTVATVPGQVKSLPRPAPYDSVVTKTKNDTITLDEIEFNNRTDALVLGGE
jgi:hypothetical protein